MVAVTRKFPRAADPHGEDMASLESVISVRGINKIYREVHALKDLDLDFPAGALTTVLGPSGCGKTTLLKIIAGLLAPTTGDVMVKGRKVTGPGPERAFVFQDFALLPWATVLRNVGFGLELRGMAEARRKEIARRYIEQVGTFNPMLKKDDENRVKLNIDRCKYWLSVGALPTDRVARFLDAAGLMKRTPSNNPQKAKPKKKRLEREAAAAEKAKAAAEAAAEAPAEPAA